MVDIKTNATPYSIDVAGKRQNVIEMECRGLEFVEFKPDGDWLCEGAESGTKFTGIDLSEDWFDYDEKTSEEVSITEIKWDIRRT